MKHLKSFENIDDDIELISIPKMFNDIKKYEKSYSSTIYYMLLSMLQSKLVGKIITYTSVNYTIRKGKVSSIEMEPSDDDMTPGLNNVDFTIRFVDDKHPKNADIIVFKELPINIHRVENDAEKFNL